MRQPSVAHVKAAASPRAWIRWAKMVLMLGLAGFCLPLAPVARAVEPGVSVYLFAERVGGNRTICVGDKVTIRARVFERVGTEGDYRLGRLIGVNIGAFLDGSGVGSIAPASATTRLDAEPMGSAYFTFTAQRTGTTTIVFQGTLRTNVVLGLTLSSTTVQAAVPMTVDDCKYRVTTYSRWTDPTGRFNVMATIKAGALSEVDGGTYAGTATVEWIIAVSQVEDCVPQSGSDTSTAEMRAQAFGPDVMVVDISFLPATISLPMYCVGSSGETATGSHTYQLTSEPFQFDASRSAGGNRRDHVLFVDGGRVIGPIIYLVTRITGN